MGFFQNIKRKYGVKVTIWLKRWNKLNIKKASFLNRRIYLLECKRNGVSPKHISQNTKSLFNLIEGASRLLIKKMHEFNKMVMRKILNFEIVHTNQVLNSIKIEMSEIHSNIISVLPRIIYDNYFAKQSTIFNKVFHKIKTRNVNKIRILVNDGRSILKTENKWFRNISSKQIPDNVRLLLSMGPKFNLHTTVKDVNIEQFLSYVEQLVSKVEKNKRNLIRAKITSITTNYLHRFRDIRNPDTKLIREVKTFKRK